jgi:hypothetical protein
MLRRRRPDAAKYVRHFPSTRPPFSHRTRHRASSSPTLPRSDGHGRPRPHPRSLLRRRRAWAACTISGGGHLRAARRSSPRPRGARGRGWAAQGGRPISAMMGGAGSRWAPSPFPTLQAAAGAGAPASSDGRALFFGGFAPHLRPPIVTCPCLLLLWRRC